MSSSFIVQRAEQLRDTMLELQLAAAREYGEALDTSEESDAFRTASAFALCVEIAHARMIAVEAAIFPDTALTEDLEHHARVYGLTRKPASAARLSVLVGNSSGAAVTYPLAGELIAHSDGTKYLPIDSFGAALASITTVAPSGSATITVEAQSTGVATTKTPGDELVWSTTPAGLNAGVEVLAVVRAGADAESNVDLAARLLAYLRSRPAAGNCADWQTWALEVSGIRQAYVYPATNPTVPSANQTPGAVTVVVLTDRTVNDGIASSGDVDNVFGYIEGTRDTSGNVLEGDERSRQKRFASLDPNDIVIMAATPVPQDVTMNVTISADEAVGAWGPLAVAAAPASTTLVLQVASTAGLARGQWIAVQSAVPGEYGWEVRKIANLTATTIDLESALSLAPAAATPLQRAWSGWEAARDAVLDVFRGIGPGDYSTADNGPTRYPNTTEAAPGRLYVSSLGAAVLGFARGSGVTTGVPGVVDVSVTTPAASVVADPQELLIPQTITFVPSN
jgi:uncharacterized phage protein gp47/JayE